MCACVCEVGGVHIRKTKVSATCHEEEFPLRCELAEKFLFHTEGLSFVVKSSVCCKVLG